MIIHGTHTMGMGISGGGQPADWGTWTRQWVHASPESSWAGWQHIRRADKHVCGGVCGDCPLEWDGAIIFISYVVVPLL